MKTLLIFVFACSAALNIYAQENSFLWNNNQPLEWTHFQGKVNDTSYFDAESFAEVRYHYRFNTPQDYYFEVYAQFNKKVSWCREQYRQKDLLKHEQLHFDIAELFARKLRNAFNEYVFSEDYNHEVKKLFDQIKSEYHLMQQVYDDETNHSLNKDNQMQWEKLISVQLSRLHPGSVVNKSSAVALLQHSKTGLNK